MSSQLSLSRQQQLQKLKRLLHSQMLHHTIYQPVLLLTPVVSMQFRLRLHQVKLVWAVPLVTHRVMGASKLMVLVQQLVQQIFRMVRLR